MCRVEPDSGSKTSSYLFKSILLIQNNQNQKIESTTEILTPDSFIRFQLPGALTTSDTFSCCIVVDAEATITKCSLLKIVNRSSYDLTLIAKIIGFLEMLVLLVLFSLCLLGVCLRFRARQQKTGFKKETDASTKTDVDGLYFITPNAKGLETSVKISLENEKALQNQDVKIDLKSLKISTTENEFPPTYEEIVLKRIERKLDTIRY